VRLANEIWAEGGERAAVVINTTDISNDMITEALGSAQPEVAAMIKWGRQIRRGGLFERDKYLTPRGIYDQMRLAQEASENDDVVAGVLETTESLAFSKMSVRCDDPDEENIWNQIMEDIDLDSRIREMWREMFTVSQFYAATWWDVKNYKVMGRNKDTGVQRKKNYPNLRVPTGLTLLDPLKITPVGNFMFNQEQLAWVANREEAHLYDNVLSGREEDSTIERLLLGRYQPREDELSRLGKMNIGGGVSQLYLLNPGTVWRHTATRSQYKPFADIRMKSVFELLDLKNLLRELDRALLLGATNFIVLIRKGSDKMPAKDEELIGLRNSVQTLSQIPVIVGDHRLEIEIITPKIDMSLQPEKYNTIDARITARLYGMFMTGNFAAGAKGDDSMKLIRIVARGLESRRSQIRRSIEREVLRKIWQRNDSLVNKPSLVFHPKSIAIDFDSGLAAFILDLLDRGWIPSATALEQVDFDIDEEAQKMQRQDEEYKNVFRALTPLQDPVQSHKFQLEQDAVEQKNLIELTKLQQKNKLEVLDKEQLVPKAVGVPAAKGTPTAASPSGTGAPAKAAPVKKAPGNADPKSGGRSGGGTRSGGGAAPGTGQGQEKDARRSSN
jgi:hypothetical protein